MKHTVEQAGWLGYVGLTCLGDNPEEKKQSPCSKGVTIFFEMGGVMNFQKYLGNIFVTPYLMIKNFMTPPPSYNVEKTYNPQCT